MTFHVSFFFVVLDEMLTQHEYDNISSQKSCYSSDTNATVSIVQRYLTTSTNITSSSRIHNPAPDIKVEPCTREFLAKHFNDVSIYNCNYNFNGKIHLVFLIKTGIPNV